MTCLQTRTELYNVINSNLMRIFCNIVDLIQDIFAIFKLLCHSAEFDQAHHQTTTKAYISIN